LQNIADRLNIFRSIRSPDSFEAS